MRGSLCGKGKRDSLRMMASEHLKLEHKVFMEVNNTEGVCVPRIVDLHTYNLCSAK